MLTATELTKCYGIYTAVDRVSFTLEQGKVYGLLGPNGAGKSSIMNMLSGYIYPTSGSIQVCGHDMFLDSVAAKKCIGYCPEVPPVYPDMTVKEYLGFAAGIKKISNIPAEVSLAIERLSIASVENKLIRNLSKGYRQRVGIAQSILGSPPLLILDEPTSGLDPEQMIDVRELIRVLSKSSTILLSSHLLSEISIVCDNVLLLAQGKLIASDTPDELEKQIYSAGSIEIEAKCCVDKCYEILGSISEITDISLHNGKMVLQTSGAPDAVKEVIFMSFAQRQIPLLTLRTVHAEFEDVFLKLIDKEGDCKHGHDSKA